MASQHSDSVRPEITSLTALRGVAALWVVLFHLRSLIPSVAPALWSTLSPFSRSGYLGVDLFFVLSGFVIAYTYYESFQSFGWRKYANYLRKRLARIYPAYCVMVLFTGARQFWKLLDDANATSASFQRVARQAGEQLLMVQGWRYPIRRTWNIISWSVSEEWLAYLLFPALVYGISRLRGARTLLTAATLYAAASVATLHALDHGGNMRVGLFRILFAFPLGMLAYRLYALRPTASLRWGVTAAMLLIGFGPLTMTWLAPRHIDPVLLAPTLFSVVVYGLARAQFSWAGHRVLLWLGHVSYCLYLVHIVALQAVRAVLPASLVVPHGNAAGIAYLTLNVALAIAAAQALHVWVEKPWRLRLLGRRAS